MIRTKTTRNLVEGRKRSRTLKTLINAALRCCAQRNFDQVSIHEIAAEAGVTHATMYNYFKSKDEVLEAVCLRLSADVVSQVKNAMTSIDDCAERISIAIRTVLEISAGNPDWGWLFLKFLASAPEFDEVGTEVSKELRAGRECGRLQYASETAAVALMTGAIHMGIRPIIFGTAGDGHANEVARLVLCGLGVPAEEAQVIAIRPLPAALAIPDFIDRK